MQVNVTEAGRPWKGSGYGQVGSNALAALLTGHPAKRGMIAAALVMLAMLLMGAFAAPLVAETYPSKPIRMILPMNPGGVTDILGRTMGQKLAERLGQPFVSENRPGAGGNIGLEIASKARPDGYTVVLSPPAIVVSPSLYKKLNYDPVKDLEPISLVAEIPNVLVVRPSLPVNSLKEFVAFARRNPGKLNFGSGGLGTTNHLVGEILNNIEKIKIVHVPYKGVNQAMVAMMGGEVDMVAIGAPSSLPHIQSGKVKALAVLNKERLPSLPNVPTAKEAGIENFEVSAWYGLLAPAGTPRDIINRLNAEWVRIAATTDARESIKKIGFEPLSSSPEEFAEFIKTETVRWRKVIREANLSID